MLDPLAASDTSSGYQDEAVLPPFDILATDIEYNDDDDDDDEEEEVDVGPVPFSLNLTGYGGEARLLF